MKLSKRMKTILGYRAHHYQKFHTVSSNVESEKEIDSVDYPDEWKRIYYKSYPRFDSIKLPNPRQNNTSLSQAIRMRKSVRNYSEKQLSIAEIGDLLYWSLGEKNILEQDSGRNYPSAGARYPIEAYLFSYDSEIEKGIYHYYVREHGLEKMWDFSLEKKEYVFTDPLLNAPVILFLTGVFARNTIKYSERGYRYALIEAGHVGQNIVLNASAFGISTCCAGGFVESKVCDLLDIDGVFESVLYAIALGK